MILNFITRNGETKTNYLLEAAKRIFTEAEIKALQAETIENPEDVYTGILQRIETSTAERMRPDIESEVRKNVSKGVFVRAEKDILGLFEGVGLDKEAITAALEGVEDKGRFKAILEAGKTQIDAKLASKAKGADTAGKERLAQLAQQIAALSEENNTYKETVTKMQAEHAQALEAQKAGFVVDQRKSGIIAGLFEGEKKLNINQKNFLTLLDAHLSAKGLTLRAEGENLLLFEGEKALQLPGTAHNYDFSKYIADFAETEGLVQKSNAKPGNNNPDKGVIIDKSVAEKIHPNAVAYAQGAPVSTGLDF